MKVILDRYDALLIELRADDLTREKWDSLIDRIEALVDETGLRHMLNPFLMEGDRRGWKDPRYN